LENPFFTREARSWSRRQYAPVTWHVLLQCFILTVPLLLLERVLGADIDSEEVRRGLALMALGVGHAALAGIVGWALGSMVLIEEHRQGTLDTLRLVSTPPRRWLPQKLLLPAYAFLVVWLAAAPFYMALSIRGHFLPRDLQPGALLSGGVGLAAFAAALLVPPEGVRQRLNQRLTASDLIADLTHLGLPYWAGIVIVRVQWDWMAALVSGRAAIQLQPFYDANLRTDHGLALLIGALLIAALASAFAGADPASRWAVRVARWTRVLAVGVAYYLFIGYTWRRIGPEHRWLALAGLPLLALALHVFSRVKKRRSEDRSAAREIRWVARRSDNPVLIRDLRVLLRTAGLRRQATVISLGLVVGMALLTASMIPLTGFFGGPPAPGPLRFLRQMAAVAVILGFWLAVPAVLTFGARASALWQMERRVNTLSQLLASPLPAETVIRGRWAAALMVGVARNSPALVAFLLGLFVISSGRGLPLALALATWLASLGLVLSAGFAGAARPVESLRELGSAVCLSVYVLLGEGLGLALVMNHTTGEVGLTLMTYSLCMAPVNLLLTYGIYRRAIADLEALRKRDFE
jgi:hypothetical protein